jgi:aminomethyltransferase
MKEADFPRIAKAAAGKATLHRADDGALLALQGPEAAAVMQDLVPVATELAFMRYGSYEWQGARSPWATSTRINRP